MVSVLLKPRWPYTFVDTIGASRRESQKNANWPEFFSGDWSPPTNFTLKNIICERADASQERDGPAFHSIVPRTMPGLTQVCSA